MEITGIVLIEFILCLRMDILLQFLFFLGISWKLEFRNSGISCEICIKLIQIEGFDLGQFLCIIRRASLGLTPPKAYRMRQVLTAGSVVTKPI